MLSSVSSGINLGDVEWLEVDSKSLLQTFAQGLFIFVIAYKQLKWTTLLNNMVFKKKHRKSPFFCLRHCLEMSSILRVDISHVCRSFMNQSKIIMQERRLSAVKLLFLPFLVIPCPDSVTPGILFGHPLCMYKQNVSGIYLQNSLLLSAWFFSTFGVL